MLSKGAHALVRARHLRVLEMRAAGASVREIAADTEMKPAAIVMVLRRARDHKLNAVPAGQEAEWAAKAIKRRWKTQIP